MESLDMNNEEYLTVEEVAGRLKVHPQTIRRAIHRGDLVAYKLQNQYRITSKAMREYVEKEKA